MKIALRKPADAASPRIGPLASLPVFLALAGRPAVVSGGSAAAAWKAELLAAAGAQVTVFAADPGPELLALSQRGASAGSLRLVARDCQPADLCGAAVAIADGADEAAAWSFVRSAALHGVPVNVIDRPELSHFQLGSIVNRSPVVIGISTSGAAPILGQAIRRRIETLLPPSLAVWAAHARDIRVRIQSHLLTGETRRRFWAQLAERAFGPAPSPDDAEALLTAASRHEPAAKGSVTLVGAGPGDAELLTLKAVRALQAADVILFDDLVSDEVLELARREARRILVGKRGGRVSCAQEEINALMIKLARQGRRVVRLKSGDPAVFGRAGEEIDELHRAGIAVDIVPGITAASALAASLGISLTHRAGAHSLRLVTGHSRAGQLPEDLDWTGLADPATTLIVYMGGRTASALAQRLIDEGLAVSTPVVVATSISRADARRRHLTLGGLAVSDADHTSDGPVLIGIGRVFAGCAALEVPPARDAHEQGLCAAAS